MNMRSLTVVLAALAISSLGACTVITGTGSAGTGGATSATTTASSSVSTSSAAGPGGNATTASSTTSTGTAMCDPTYTCVQAIAQGSGDPAELCDGPALKEFDALSACTCTGNCAAICKDNACAQLDPTAECKACLSTPDTGCKTELDNCVNGT